MTELAYLQPQENFPREDLTEENAELLAFILSNEATLNKAHTAAEHFNLLFKIGHGILIAASKPYVLEYEADALSDGIGLYENIATLVSPDERLYRNTIGVGSHTQAAGFAISTNFEQETSSLPQLFKNHRPNTSYVIEKVASQFHHGAVEYSLVGAALAYELDMGTLLEFHQGEAGK